MRGAGARCRAERRAPGLPTGRSGEGGHADVQGMAGEGLSPPDRALDPLSSPSVPGHPLRGGSAERGCGQGEDAT